jgi:hypothetical protein
MVTKANELINSMKRNTDNQFYLNLVGYLELQLELKKTMLVGADDMDEVKRIQGRCRELSDMLKALTRKPVNVSQHSGAFN